MQMTDGEIRMMYKLAANPKRQVFILAELNNCTPEKIAKIVNAPESMFEKQTRNRWTAAEDAKADELLRLGYSLEDVAIAVGKSRLSVYERRRYLRMKEGAGKT